MLKRAFYRFCCLLSLTTIFLLALNQVSWAEPRPAFIRQEFSQVAKIWPGQRLTLYITLYTTTSFSGSTHFELPEVSGMLVMENEDRPLLGTKAIAGSSYIYKRHEIIVFPLRSGVRTLPPFNVEFSIKNDHDKIVEQNFTTTSIKLKILAIPGATAQDKIITTPNLQVREQWRPQPGRVRVGDALTRTITLTAEELPGMVFPPFGLEKVAGLGFYSKQPQVEDQRARGQFTGSRTETITYVCEETGIFKIPGLSFKWWNPNSEILKEISLKSVEFTVIANPLLQKEGPADTGRAAATDFPWKWTALIVLFSILVCALFFCYRAKSRHQRSNLTAQEKELFINFQREAATQDAAATMRALLKWLDYSGCTGTPGSLKRFSSMAQDSQLEKELEALEMTLYASNSGRQWSGIKLAPAVQQTRKNLRDRRSRSKPSSLPKLNPSGPLAK